MRTLARVLSLGLIFVLFVPANAEARKHKVHRDSEPSATIKLLLRQNAAIERMQQKIDTLSRLLNPDYAGTSATVPIPRNRVMASLDAMPNVETPRSKRVDHLMPRHVFPATATQRGQFRDQRRTHRHAGIDLGGVYGSEIVASFGGVVLPAPGRDRGYGPHVVVIQGNDGIVYRYAHLATVAVKVGQRVATGQRIGTMGKVGAKGFPHLHFEMMRVAEYRRRPYGVHSLDPNDYLGGSRGKRMVVGAVMIGEAARAYAARHAPSKVADVP